MSAVFITQGYPAKTQQQILLSSDHSIVKNWRCLYNLFSFPACLVIAYNTQVSFWIASCKAPYCQGQRRAQLEACFQESVYPITESFLWEGRKFFPQTKGVFSLYERQEPVFSPEHQQWRMSFYWISFPKWYSDNFLLEYCNTVLLGCTLASYWLLLSTLAPVMTKDTSCKDLWQWNLWLGEIDT